MAYQPTISKPSNPVHFINIPKLFDKVLNGFSCKFFYNFYTTDEKTQDKPTIPDVYKKSTISKDDINLTTFSLRAPRYVELSWASNDSIKKTFTNANIEKHHSKIFTQDSIASSRYMSYNFSSLRTIENAIEDINSDVIGQSLSSNGKSQASIVDDFITELIKGYEESVDKPDVEETRKQIKIAIDSIEKFADKSDSLLGYKFYNDNDKNHETSFDKLTNQNIKLFSQINSKITADVFNLTMLSTETLTKINNFSTTYAPMEGSTEDDLFIQPVEMVALSLTLSKNIPDASQSIEVIGFVIDKYGFKNNSYVKDKTFFIENTNTNSILDVNVMYGMTYYYAIRAVAKLEIPAVEGDKILKCTYYCAGKPVIATVTCEENIPPPPPVELNFVLDHKTNRFYVTWQMPFNSQRDIKQFQIFRRTSIYEPFELLEQHCFDFSDIKQATGESIDGNGIDTTKEDAAYIKYFKEPSCNYLDEEFKIDFENSVSSKYIYAMTSIDAHGLISSYSAQHEIGFDFFKNQLTRNLISNSGAPRPYPNLLLNADLFKDIIQVSGISSHKLKVYFMPEYFKIIYDSGKIEKMVTTNQDGSHGGYYKLQFINTQNQKLDQLKITIDDPKLLTKI